MSFQRPAPTRRASLLAALCAAAANAGCGILPAEPERSAGFGLSAERAAAAAAALALRGDEAVLVAAGDIARCESPAPAEATAALTEAIVAAAGSALLITTGDHAYPNGTRAELERCYGSSWGRFQPLTRPSPGNHDYATDDGAPYFDYFDHYRANPEDRTRGYYSFAFAGWHVVSLNSVEPIEAGSAQLAWLEQDLASTAARCILAYWHHPRFSSGLRSLNPWFHGRDMRDVWALLERHGTDVVVNGHEHFYERFAPQDAAGRPAAGGIRQFTVGTGGGDLKSAVVPRRDREAAYDEGYGVLALVLEPDLYAWAFLGTDGTVHDRGTPTQCTEWPTGTERVTTSANSGRSTQGEMR